MGKKTGKNKVPDGWENYSNTGTVINGTRFVALKVPLKDEILRKIPYQNKWWGIPQLQSSLPQLKLVIDLTNTDRYYSVRDLEDRGIRHVKIETEGCKVPGDDVVRQFFMTVDETFDGSDDDDEGLVGVHCTHGVNRTGYMICRYMVERMDMEPDLAIHAFDEARGHKQDRANYLKNLRAKAWEL